MRVIRLTLLTVISTPRAPANGKSIAAVERRCHCDGKSIFYGYTLISKLDHLVVTLKSNQRPKNAKYANCKEPRLSFL